VVSYGCFQPIPVSNPLKKGFFQVSHVMLTEQIGKKKQNEENLSTKKARKSSDLQAFNSF